MTRSQDPAELRLALDDLAHRSRRVLASWALKRDLRLTSAASIVWILAGPSLMFVAQTLLVVLGRAPLAVPLWGWALLAVAGPILYIAGRVVWLWPARRQDRRTCLGAYDRQLNSQDRLVTADEFVAQLGGPSVSLDARGATTDQFKQAAIEDAASTVAHAMEVTLAPPALPAWSVSPRGWAAVPAAIALMLAALWVGRLATTIQGANGHESASAAIDLESLPAKVVARLLDLRPASPRPERRSVDDPAAANESQSSRDATTPTQRSLQDADGQSHSGSQANSKSSSQSQSSPGTPSNQQAPSPPVDEDEKQDPQKPSATPPKKSDLAKSPQQASSATSGQGQSKSSSTDKTAIPAADQPDRAGANKDDGPDEAGIQDEVEEEKTSGVERPSLRKNKPPVDRNLSPRPTGDQPNPNANGRSGPGGRKKTRGVPSMILGVPTPDRIQGMTNPGRSKVTQENSTPKEEPQSALTAEARRAREAAFGHIEHPLLQSWMLNLVEQYFLQIRGKAQAPPPSTKDNR